MIYKQESEIAAEIKNISHKMTSESLPVLESKKYSNLEIVLNLIVGIMHNKPKETIMDMSLLYDLIYMYCTSQSYFKLIKEEIYKVFLAYPIVYRKWGR